MNNKEIETLNKKIEMLQDYSNYLKEKHDLCYKEFGCMGSNLIPDNYEVEHKIKDLQYLVSVLNILNAKKIDISKKYFIMPNVYLSIFLWGDSLTFHFYVDNDAWLYDNFMSSHSGINEWIMKTVEDAYDLYSGNSEYNYAFGTVTLSGYKNIIENKKKDDKFYNERRYSAEEVANAIDKLIKFFTDKKNITRNAIVKDLNFKFSMMKKIIPEEE